MLHTKGKHKALLALALITLSLCGLWLPSPAWAGGCRLVWGDDPGDACCNACCYELQNDLALCRLLRWCRLCCAWCVEEAQRRYERCALQCAIDYPEFIDECEA